MGKHSKRGENIGKTEENIAKKTGENIGNHRKRGET